MNIYIIMYVCIVQIKLIFCRILTKINIIFLHNKNADTLRIVRRITGVNVSYIFVSRFK